MKKVLLNCPSGTIICTCQKTWKMACKQQAKINLLSTFDTRSATRLAIFERSWWKSLAKVAQIFVNFVSYFDKHIFFSINCCGFFLGNYCWNWGAFYSTIRSHWTRVTTYLCFIGFWFCALIYLLVDSHLLACCTAQNIHLLCTWKEIVQLTSCFIGSASRFTWIQTSKTEG